jgi:hypothetical protein
LPAEAQPAFLAHHRRVPGRLPHHPDFRLAIDGQDAFEFGIGIVEDQVAHRTSRRGHGHFDQHALGAGLDAIDQAEIDDIGANLGVGDLAQGIAYLFGVGRYNGAGMAVIADAVEQGTALPWDFACKIFLTALTLAVGFKGGEVVPSFYIGATFGCIAGPWLGLPAGFAGAIGLVCVFCGATNALIPSILLGFELFGGQGLELIALGCGVCYMLSGHHGLYSSQTFVTNKLRPEYASHKWRVKLKKKEE